jgi:hypothetical protein
VTRNTFVGNEGTGPLACSGGAILIDDYGSIRIEGNIFFDNRDCAVYCRRLDGDLETNVFWHNSFGNVRDDPGCFPDWEEDNLLVDPQFCDPLTDNFTVSKDSPALGELGPIGAFTNPGCGDGVGVEQVSWGLLKARYE